MSLTAFDQDTYPVSLQANQETAALSPLPMVATRERPPKWLRDTITKLQNLATLQENWDSYGASPVNADSIFRAQELVCYLAMFVGVDEPAVGATPDGEAGLSWDGGPWSLDVDIAPDGRIDYVYIDDRDSSQDVEMSTRRPHDLLMYLTGWD